MDTEQSTINEQNYQMYKKEIDQLYAYIGTWFFPSVLTKTRLKHLQRLAKLDRQVSQLIMHTEFPSKEEAGRLLEWTDKLLAQFGPEVYNCHG